MQIAPASLQDIENIMELIRNCITDMESQAIYQWNEHYPTAEIFEEDIKSRSLFILKDNGDFLGIITLNEEQSPEYQALDWSVTNGKVLVIHRLAVNPVWQRRGIGRMLMDFAENYATENAYASIRLDAYSRNPRALNLYERREFKKTGEIFFPGRELCFYCYEKVISQKTNIVERNHFQINHE